MHISDPLNRPWRWAQRLLSTGETPPDAEQAARPAIPPKRRRVRAKSGKPVGLALQGGGAHGAFTWGVLDRLLEDGSLRIEALSGASAGALNAVIVANGLINGGPEAAREELTQFWRRISSQSIFMPYRATFVDRLFNGWNLDGTGQHFGLDMATRLMSPYQFNPFDHNPLRTLLEQSVDFERLQRIRRIRLFIAATEVSTGQARIFRTAEITADSILASAALPAIHHAVEIDGLHYWDGGYSANPPLIPLIEHGSADDILLIQIDPAHEQNLPVTATEIRNRMARLTFSAPLTRELETIQWMAKLARRTVASPLAKRFLVARLHRIDAGDALASLGQVSKLNPEWGLLQHAHDIGRDRTGDWLADNAAHGGKRASFEFPAEPDA
jgi:NTE family protein